MAAISGRALIERIEQARDEGRVGVLITGNVDDRIVADDSAPFLPHAILRYFAEKGFDTGVASLSGGLAPGRISHADGEASPIPTRPGDGDPVRLLLEITGLLRNAQRPVAILLRHPSHFAPRGDHASPSERACAEILYGWSVDECLRQSGSFLVLLDPEDNLHDLVRQRAWGFKAVRAGYPTHAERAAFVGLWAEKSQARERVSPVKAAASARVAGLTGGLRLVELAALLRGASARAEGLSEEWARAERAAKISERLDGIAEVKEPTTGWADVAGLAHVKEHFQEVARAARGRGPSGLTGATLLAGVPGVGKSFSAQALARELRVPIVFVRNLYDQWVGSSEARVERLVETLVAFDGCVCVFEEVDQLLGRRDAGPSADGGTTERVRGRLMEFMGGGYPGVHFVGLTNRPDLLDVANQDRFGVLIPVLHPGRLERVELLRVLFAQEGRAPADDVDLSAVAALPNLELSTGRSLRDIVRMAGRLADRESGRTDTPVAQRHLECVVSTFQPSHDPLEHEFLALSAIGGCQFQAHLPWMSWDGLRKEVEVPRYLSGIVDAASGRVDREALARRLGELGARRMARRLG